MSDFLDQMRQMGAASLPPTSGELHVGGLRSSVEVLFDGWGVPYITASNLDDLWFAQGFISASERLFQIDLAIRQANGRLSELFGERTLRDDIFTRTIGLHIAGANYVRDWDDEDRAMIGRFVEGVHSWVASMAAKPLEYQLIDAEPAIPRDLESWAACWAQLGWYLSGNVGEELLRMELTDSMGADAAARLMPPIAPNPPGLAAGGLARRSLDTLRQPPSGRGSNNWAVAGSRTKSGKPMLANDPHLQAQQPAIWLEFHLRAPGYEARGVSLPFHPGIALGTTAHHSWGVTNVTGDTQDVYLEEISSDGSSARTSDGWEPLQTRVEQIEVRGEKEPATFTVRESRHGPLLDEFPVGEHDVDWAPIGKSVAVRWAGRRFGMRPTTFIRVASAGSFGEFREAVFGLRCPGQNFVYADIEGHIGYQCTGAYPVRRTGDGTVPVPGWTDEHEWAGWIADEDLPWSLDPDGGSVVTANNRIHDEDYPHLIGKDFHTPFRAARIAEMIGAREDHDPSSFAAIQRDTISIPSRDLLKALTKLEPADEDQRAALDALAAWDGDASSRSPEAALFNCWIRSLAEVVVPDAAVRSHYLVWREMFVVGALARTLEDGELTDAQLRTSLAVAIEEAAGRTWGQMHRVRFAHPLSSIPGLEGLFVAAEHELGGDEQSVSAGGMDFRVGYDAQVISSWRAIYDMADIDRSLGVLTTGQSGHPSSAHWNDQNALWAAGEHHPLPFTRAAVEAAAESALYLVPG